MTKRQYNYLINNFKWALAKKEKAILACSKMECKTCDLFQNNHCIFSSLSEVVKLSEKKKRTPVHP